MQSKIDNLTTLKVELPKPTGQYRVDDPTKDQSFQLCIEGGRDSTQPKAEGSKSLLKVEEDAVESKVVEPTKVSFQVCF